MCWWLLPPFGPSQIPPVGFSGSTIFPYQGPPCCETAHTSGYHHVWPRAASGQWSPNTAMLRHCLGALQEAITDAPLLQVIAWKEGLNRLEWLLVFCSKGPPNEARTLRIFTITWFPSYFLIYVASSSEFFLCSFLRRSAQEAVLKACISENVFILQGRKIYISPQMSPWHANYFELKAIEAPKTQSLFPFPP